MPNRLGRRNDVIGVPTIPEQSAAISRGTQRARPCVTIQRRARRFIRGIRESGVTI